MKTLATVLTFLTLGSGTGAVLTAFAAIWASEANAQWGWTALLLTCLALFLGGATAALWDEGR